jgi:hypothetical protein
MNGKGITVVSLVTGALVGTAASLIAKNAIPSSNKMQMKKAAKKAVKAAGDFVGMINGGMKS